MGLRCSECGGPTRVYDSDPLRINPKDKLTRYRVCLSCSVAGSTVEVWERVSDRPDLTGQGRREVDLKSAKKSKPRSKLKSRSRKKKAKSVLDLLSDSDRGAEKLRAWALEPEKF